MTTSPHMTETLAAMGLSPDDIDPTILLRVEVANDRGLKPSLAKRLRGSTREELEQDADELLELFPHLAPPDPDELDPRKLAAKVRRL